MNPNNPMLGRFEQVRNGPKHPYYRSCTDVFCLILMLINIGVLIAFAIYGYITGDTTNVYRATDQKGNICGASNTATANYPYAYFYNPTTNDLSHRTCVQNCPNYNSGTLSSINCYASGNSQNKCTYDVTVNQNGSYNTSPSNTNQIIGYDCNSIIGRVCIPTSPVFDNAFSSYPGAFSNYLRQAGVANFITDIQYNWKWLLLALVLAVIISIVFMFMLRCFAGCFVWLSLFLVVLLFVALGIVFLYNGGAIPQNNFIGNLGIPLPNLPSFAYYNIFGYIVFGIAALLLIIILCCCGRIRLAVALCGIAGQFIASTVQVVLVPVIMGLFVFGLWVFALFAMVCLIGTATFVVNGNDVFTSIQNYASSSLGFFYYFIFGTLWTNALLIAIAIFVVAAACAVWYFSKSPGVTLDSPVCTGFWMAFRYHLGSLSFGSFLMALIGFIQFIFELFFKPEEASEATAGCCSWCAGCCRCCLECIRKIIQFLNRNAYILIAITGKNFCGASSDAVALIITNPLRYAIVGIVGFILAFVGKFLIAALTTFLFYLFITFVPSVKASVQQPIFLLVLVGITSFTIAAIFMSVFDIAVDTLLACFLIDQQTNVKAIYAPFELVELMDR